MSKKDMLLNGLGSRIRESASVRPPMAGMPGIGAGVVAGDARDVGVSRSKVAQVIRLERIARDPSQPREEFDEDALGRLADSMRARGVLQPIAVRWDEGRGVYVVVVGERRWRAAGLAGLESIPCTVMDGAIPPDELLAIQCMENLLREDLRPVEQARAFRTLMDVHGWSGHRLAKELGVSQGGIAQSLALLNLPPTVQDAVEQGGLAPTIAYEVSKLDRPEDQSLVAEVAVAQGLRRSEVAELARSVRSRRPAPAARPEPVTIDLGECVVSVKWKKAGTMTGLQALARASKELRGRERAETPSSADAA